MSVRQGNKVIAGHISYHPDLFDYKWADHLLNDISWLRADTFSWQDGGVYQAAYNHLADDISGKSLSTETIAGITVQFYLADDGHKICPDSQESNVVSIYNATGVAWYYIVDTTNQRFKLPRISPVKEMLALSTSAPVVTNGLQPIFTDGSQSGSLRQGMKNLNGNTHYMFADGVNVAEWSSTALKFGSQTGLKVDLSQTTSASYFKGNKYLYFYIGNFTQTAIENTAGLNASLFNGKADIDLTNVSSAGKAESVSWGRNFIKVGALIAQGNAGIAGAYDLSQYLDGDTTNTKMGLFSVQLNTSQAGFSTFNLKSDATDAVTVCGTNNQFSSAGSIWLPFKYAVRISFDITGAGIATGTFLSFSGYLKGA